MLLEYRSVIPHPVDAESFQIFVESFKPYPFKTNNINKQEWHNISLCTDDRREKRREVKTFDYSGVLNCIIEVDTFVAFACCLNYFIVGWLRFWKLLHCLECLQAKQTINIFVNKIMKGVYTPVPANLCLWMFMCLFSERVGSSSSTDNWLQGETLLAYTSIHVC